MNDWHSIQFETEYRTSSRIPDPELRHRARRSWLGAVQGSWRGFVVPFGTRFARRLVAVQPVPGVEGGRG